MAADQIFPPLYQQWAQAVADRDRTALAALFDPQYSYTSPDGQRMSRDQILDLEMTIPPPQLPFREFTVQPVSEHVVIVRGGHALKGEFPAGAVRPELAEQIAAGVEIAFTSVWRRQDDGWHVVSNDAHIVQDS